MVRLILVVALLILSVTFCVQNREEEAILHYFGGSSTPTPIYKPILSAFGAGLLIMGILLFPAWIKLRMELRRSRKALQLAEDELDRFRNPVGASGSRPPVPFPRVHSPDDEDVL
jgi:putative membrane protein